MFKRKDWVFSHNPDTGDVSSDSDESDDECEEDVEEPPVILHTATGRKRKHAQCQVLEGVGAAASKAVPARSIAVKGKATPGLGALSDEQAGSGSEEDATSASDLADPSVEGSDATSDPGTDGDSAEDDSGDDEDKDGGEGLSFQDMSLEQLQEMMANAQDQSDDEDGKQPTRKRKRSAFSDREALDDQKGAWLTASGPNVVRGEPLRCVLCKGALLLNSQALQAHMLSKRHLANAKRAGVADKPEEQLDAIVWAEALSQADLSSETHRERRDRLAAMASKGTASKGAEGTGGDTDALKIRAGSGKARRQKRGGQQWRSKQDAKKQQARKGKPGKRQRLANKLAANEGATKGASSSDPGMRSNVGGIAPIRKDKKTTPGSLALKPDKVKASGSTVKGAPEGQAGKANKHAKKPTRSPKA